MNVLQSVFLAGFTVAIVLSLYAAMDRWNSVPVSVSVPVSKKPLEGFEDSPAVTDAAIQALRLQNPTDADAAQAHKTLLRYTQTNFNKGIAIIINIANQFYGPGLVVRKDLDPTTLLGNYTNPLQGT
jgi:hypothetical protein